MGKEANDKTGAKKCNFKVIDIKEKKKQVASVGGEL